MAIACVFNEYLSEQLSFITAIPWGMGVDSSLHKDLEESIEYYFAQPIQSLSNEQCQSHIIQMIVNQCLALKKLTMVVENNWNRDQLELYNEQ
ncbi:unnamed protein product [Adineta steineri]|uniref:Uncharacterized protein n=1 Tax=Adineta steineri TaxID=433720 RepID=A0A819YNI6_9BILA|nr:unnamed protein product [Adineta steineri]CAF4157514.1 unnamed protein product [Adineta steineri]